MMKNLITILCLCLFWFSCDSPTDPEPEPSEIDVDWVLIKSPNIMTYDSDLNGNGGFIDTLCYYFVYTNSSLIDFSNNSRPNIDLFDFPIFEMECLDFEDLGEIYISFIYNDEEFSYDISDVYIDEDLSYPLTGWYSNVDRIVYNPEMSYFMVFTGSTSNIINSSTPNELIDYR